MSAPVNYRRPESVRTPNRTILIVTHGELTEIEYFSGLKRELRLPGVTIKAADHSDPKAVYDYAKRKKADYDEIWCILDVDEFSSQIKDVLSKTANSKIQCAVSNPCFELWLFLHFKYSTGSLSPQETVEKLKHVLPSYDKTRLRFSDFSTNLDTAIQYAKKLERHHQENHINVPCDSNPYTSVYVLIETMQKENRKGVRVIF